MYLPWDTFTLGHPQCLFLNWIEPSILFCQVVLVIWAFPGLASWLTGHFPLPNRKWLWRVLLLTPGDWQGGKKGPGVAATDLYRGQADSTTGNTVGRTAVALSCPQVPTVAWASGTAGRTARGRGQTQVSFSLWSPVMPQFDPLMGVQSKWLGATLCVRHTWVVAGQSCSEFGWKLLPLYPIRVYSKTRASHPHANLPKLLPSSCWSPGEPRA